MTPSTTLTGYLVDVKRQQITYGTLVLKEGKIANIVPSEPDPENCRYILPGFVDSHIHIESTLLLPHHFAEIALKHGTIGVVTDPHEIANVLGVEGIEYMIDSARHTLLHFSFGIPSGVPCTETFETAGAKITADDIKKLLPRPEFYGLAEMMNYVGILSGDQETCNKVRYTLECGKVVDGHAPGVTGEEAQRYIATGISTDHEMYDLKQAQERLRMGMKILIREGSAARNFEVLSPLLADDQNKGNLMFCTDDIYPDELQEGHIDLIVRRAIEKGYPLWNVLYAACVAPVKHYKMPIGLLQEGDKADFIIVDDLQHFHVQETYIGGVPVSQTKTDYPISSFPNHFNAQPLNVEDLRVQPQCGKIKVIVSQEQQLLTDIAYSEPLVIDNNVVSNVEEDVLKLVVYNRYKASRPAIGFIRGFGLRKGAMASTIAHDSHNIIAVGVKDEEIVEAINLLVRSQGGICVVGNQESHLLPLPIAGLMSPLCVEEVGESHRKLKEIAYELGCTYQAPFMTLAFMALPVIPQLKLTDKGLFDVTTFSPTGVFC